MELAQNHQIAPLFKSLTFITVFLNCGTIQTIPVACEQHLSHLQPVKEGESRDVQIPLGSKEHHVHVVRKVWVQLGIFRSLFG